MHKIWSSRCDDRMVVTVHLMLDCGGHDEIQVHPYGKREIFSEAIHEESVLRFSRGQPRNYKGESNSQLSYRRVLEVGPGDQSSHKREVKTHSIPSKLVMGTQLKRSYGEGSLFSPLLFGKFFNTVDTFPLWEFDSDSPLGSLQECLKTSLDWDETDSKHV